MDSKQQALNDKVAFFTALRASQTVDDDFDVFDARESALRQESRAFFSKPEKRVTEAVPGQHRAVKPSRAHSAPTPVPVKSNKVIKATPAGASTKAGRLASLLNDGSSFVVGETPIPDSNAASRRRPQRSGSTPLPVAKRLLSDAAHNSPSVATAQKRRKRDSPLNMRPQDERIFKDLVFFYVPDNDIAPARRIRITKAREHGAAWTRDAATATHIVVEKNISFKDIEGVLSRASRRGFPAVVNENYPIDCIQFKAILNHDQKKYQLPGQPSDASETEITDVSLKPEKSAKVLELKAPQNNPKKWDYVPPAGTPRPSDESSQIGTAESPILVDSEPIFLDIEGVGESLRAKSSSQEDAVRGITRNYGQRKTNEEDISGKGTDDELSEFISIMQEFKHLPLDNEIDDMHSVPRGYADAVVDECSVSDEEQKSRQNKKDLRAGRKNIAFEDRFACNKASTQYSKSKTPNARTIEVLQKMADYYDRTNDPWRTTGYRKAISTLKRQDVKITSEEEAFKLPHIGRRLAQKIEEIVVTDKLQRLEHVNKEPNDQALQLFLNVYGAGTRQAQQWVAQGFRTLDDLAEKAKLSFAQRVGVQHYDDLNTRIPRREVEALGAVVKRTAARIDSDVEMIIGGSYRRGSKDSNDIDLIVTKAKTESSTELKPFLNSLVRRLEMDGFIVVRLASSRSEEDGSKWHGCCVLPKIKSYNDENYRPTWRRIDFLLVPASELGGALIYFTGDDIFNRSMRLLASKKGMKLNQRGLYTNVLRAAGDFTKTTLLEGKDERRIFEILGVKWREPHERWC